MIQIKENSPTIARWLPSNTVHTDNEQTDTDGAALIYFKWLDLVLIRCIEVYKFSKACSAVEGERHHVRFYSALIEKPFGRIIY